MIEKKKKKENNKKKQKLKNILYGIILFVSFCTFFFIMCIRTKPVDEYKEKGPLGVRFQRDILIEARKRIGTYNIDNNSSITIDAKALIKNKEYKKCNGTVKIIRHRDKYEYFPVVDCGENDVKLQLKTLGSLVANITTIDNDIMISSYENAIIDNNRLIAGNLIISLYDDNGNLKWMSEPISMAGEENVYLDIVDVNRLGNYYYVLCNKPKYNGKETEDCIGYYLKYNLEGKLIESNSLDIDGYKIIAVNNYVGNTNEQRYYYSGYVKLDGEENYTKCLIYFDKDGFHIFNKDKLKEVSKYFNIGFMVDDNYIYGLFHDDSRDSLKTTNNDLEYPVSLYKYDVKTNAITTNKFYTERGAFDSEYVTMITDNNVYYLYGEVDNSSKKHVLKYDKDLKYISEIDYDNYMSKPDQHFFGYAARNDSIFYNYYDNEGIYTSEADFEDKFIKTIELLDESVFNQYYMDCGVYLDKKIVQMFVDNNGNAILAFYDR